MPPHTTGNPEYDALVARYGQHKADMLRHQQKAAKKQPKPTPKAYKNHWREPISYPSLPQTTQGPEKPLPF